MTTVFAVFTLTLLRVFIPLLTILFIGEMVQKRAHSTKVR
jgi:hypothetical protein